jgi:flagellar biosynthesis/type III secretory pathway protein FliH
MTNNKQQTAVDSIIKFIKNNQYFVGNDLNEFLKQAKQMEKQQKQISYAEGYAEGYKRGLEIIKWNIENQLKKANENTN